MDEILKYIKEQLSSIGINYAFLRWNKDIVYPYFTGEYNKPEKSEEDQYRETTFTLTGFTRNAFSELQEADRKIELLFDEQKITLENCFIVISYAGSFPIPIDEADLKKIQINLKIKEWRVK